jgi:hypothetical protein
LRDAQGRGNDQAGDRAVAAADAVQLAHLLRVFRDLFRPADALSAPAAWLGIYDISTKIYYDFSGPTDMAIGLALVIFWALTTSSRWSILASWHITR